VRHNGEIRWLGDTIYISEALIGEPVGLLENEDGSSARSASASSPITATVCANPSAARKSAPTSPRVRGEVPDGRLRKRDRI
jgi:hypothetical protein